MRLIEVIEQLQELADEGMADFNCMIAMNQTYSPIAFQVYGVAVTGIWEPGDCQCDEGCCYHQIEQERGQTIWILTAEQDQQLPYASKELWNQNG